MRSRTFSDLGSRAESAASAAVSQARACNAARSRGPFGSKSSVSPRVRPAARPAASVIRQVQPSLGASRSASASARDSVSAAQSRSLVPSNGAMMSLAVALMGLS
jgi:hypothetical protein